MSDNGYYVTYPTCSGVLLNCALAILAHSMWYRGGQARYHHAGHVLLVSGPMSLFMSVCILVYHYIINRITIRGYKPFPGYIQEMSRGG